MMDFGVDTPVIGHGLEHPQNLSAGNKLKRALILGDAMAIGLAYSVELFAIRYSSGHGALRAVVLVIATTLAGLWAVRSQGLLRSRVSSVRVLEITRIARATMILGGLAMLIDRAGHFEFAIHEVATASLLTLVFLTSFRSFYRSWLCKARERGLYCRNIVLIGTDGESARLYELFKTHRDIGIEVIGVIGNHADAQSHGLQDLWLGDVDDAEALVARANASGVVVSPTGVPMGRLNSLIRNLHERNVHVHLATGISGIDARRLRSTPLAHEPLLYVEAPSLARMQLLSKRITDVVLASTALVVLSPILALIALLIKLDDGGPVFFTQTRVGRSGRLFGVKKFRTMSVDAEQLVAQLKASNERNGPLFKMTHDPRVTRVGRFLRDSGLDELAQLMNVVRGEMSLVGPRPALPAEVENFSSALRARELVMPGITGLWQVEARDNPSFEAYRRLDLFYVENWSTTLDLLIILATVEQFASRLLGLVWKHARTADPIAVRGVSTTDAAETLTCETLTCEVSSIDTFSSKGVSCDAIAVREGIENPNVPGRTMPADDKGRRAVVGRFHPAFDPGVRGRHRRNALTRVIRGGVDSRPHDQPEPLGSL